MLIVDLLSFIKTVDKQPSIKVAHTVEFAMSLLKLLFVTILVILAPSLSTCSVSVQDFNKASTQLFQTIHNNSFESSSAVLEGLSYTIIDGSGNHDNQIDDRIDDVIHSEFVDKSLGDDSSIPFVHSSDENNRHSPSYGIVDENNETTVSISAILNNDESASNENLLTTKSIVENEEINNINNIVGISYDTTEDPTAAIVGLSCVLVEYLFSFETVSYFETINFDIVS